MDMTHITPLRIGLCAIVSFMVMLCSCGKSTPDEMLAQAEEAISHGDPSEAVECCKKLEDENLSVNQLCRSALIYAKAPQLGNRPEHMAMASSCLKKAIALQPDSVTSYISSLQYADMATLNEVYGLSRFNPDSVRIDDYLEYIEDPMDMEVLR